jgi:hypothetical protein
MTPLPISPRCGRPSPAAPAAAAPATAKET